MTWVKICGITNLEDALVAVEAGADAVGFVFYEKSPRNITPEKARDIVNQLPECVEKVGVVVVDSSIDSAIDIVHITRTAGLTAIQQHMSFSPSTPAQPSKATGRDLFPKRFQVFISFPAALVTASEQGMTSLVNSIVNVHRKMPDRAFAQAGLMETFFLDSGNSAHPGGTGETFDWKKAVPFADGMREGGLKLVVAGGLTPENVGEAMNILHPWGIDVSSGVEAKPGKKDPRKVRAFVKAVREVDKTDSRN
jgi:phosphoribosylanthranilate isomerase